VSVVLASIGAVGDASAEIRLVAWVEADLGLLRRQNTPEMTEHLGGPETEEKILGRHRRYLRLADSGAGEMFAIALDGERVGSVGYWERSWHDELVYEVGWNVVSAFQGRGIATVAAKAAAERAKARHRHKHLHAYPPVGNPASNAICRKAGFTLLVETDFEYPPGTMIRCNDWRLEL
jgi:RimJ/RimL family protein N-acetyltransferase